MGQHKFNPQVIRNKQQQQMMQLDLTTLPRLRCPNCTGTVFAPVLHIHVVPELMQGMVGTSFIHVQLWECRTCGFHHNQDQLIPDSDWSKPLELRGEPPAGEDAEGPDVGH